MRPSLLDAYFRPVTALKGVGESLALHLARLLGTAPGIPNLRDLVFHLPVGLLARTTSPSIAEAPIGAPVLLLLDIASHHPAAFRGQGGFGGWQRSKGGPRIPYRIMATDAKGQAMQLVFFNARGTQLAEQLPVGQQRVVGGVLEHANQGMQMVHPDLIAIPEKFEASGKPEPIYPLTAGVSSRQVRRVTQMALAQLPALPEWQDAAFIISRAWPNFLQALKAAHQPEAAEDFLSTNPAKQRLAYDELLASQLALGLMRARTKRLDTPKLTPSGQLQERVMAQLPYDLTQGQKDVLAEIAADLARGERMQRLLQGDVGSGKTLIALMAMLMVVESGGQAAIMAPTEILARQHLATLGALCAPLGVKVMLLTGSLKTAEKKRALLAAADGSAQIMVGTHSLFSEAVEFRNLQLAVIDEQHRFGVAQRLSLTEKATVPHLLLMTATPIPRSLTMTAFGDMDSSILREKPPGRQPITTRAVPQARTEEVLQGLTRAIANGDKVYWICPMVEEQDDFFKTDLAAAETRYTEFTARFGGRVALVHGRMKQPAREAAMEAFAGEQADILVATTVVEVGVNVPSATIIVIEHAERFGLSQLHQLRGRVGRGSKASSCILLYGDKLGEVSKARLNAMRETEDGFRIAEEDLRLRGPGEILGTKQSGIPDFRFASLAANADLIGIAHDDVRLILMRDPELQSDRGQALRHLLYLFGQDAMARYLAGG